MLINNLRVALRGIISNKGYSLVNILGLAISLAVCMPILLWITEQFRYDDFHATADRLAIVVRESRTETERDLRPMLPAPIAPRLAEAFPDIDAVVRSCTISKSLNYADQTVQCDFSLVDPSFLTVFSFPLKWGDTASALADPGSVVLSEELASRLFGDKNPLGQQIMLEGRLPAQITGVMEKIPEHSSIRPEALTHIRLAPSFGKKPLSEWGGHDYATWLLLNPNADREAIQTRVSEYCAGIFHEIGWPTEGLTLNFTLHPISNIRLHGWTGEGGLMNIILILGVIALGMLFIASLNYSSLVTARAAYRGKEIGIRKALGASRAQVFKQLLLETILLNIISLPLAVALLQPALPAFNNLLGTSVKLDVSDPLVLGIPFIIAVVTGVLTGLYPALHLSNMRPISGIGRRLLVGRSGRKLRRGAVVFQIALSIILLLTAGGIHRQAGFLLEKDLGLNIDNVVRWDAPPGLGDHFGTLQERLSADPAILSVGGAEQNICNVQCTIGPARIFGVTGGNKELPVHLDRVTTGYAGALGIEMTAGRFFSAEFPSDIHEGVVLNQTAVEVLGFTDPIGKSVRYWGRGHRIIGITKDYHFEPLNSDITPLVLEYRARPRQVYARIDPRYRSEALEKIAAAHLEIDPTSKPNITFLEDEYSRMYAGVEQAGNLLNLTSVIALAIASLGILGLVSFITGRRQRELSIRKVLGASALDVIGRVISEVAVLAGIGVLIGVPVSLALVDQWLDRFAFRALPGAADFVAPLAAIAVIIMISVGYPAIKAAMSNPAEVLRRE